MGKNKRKRRLKEEDFKKKKLRVGKKLPMPDNLTRTSFKAKSINIAQQNLKQDGGEEGNFKAQKLKDLLNSCSHYNAQAREDALRGLKDLFEGDPLMLKNNLNNILQKILGMSMDLETSVRKAFLVLISLVFRSLSEIEILPFFANIMAYVSSAITHLNKNVCLDSLKFLDLCLQHFPQQVKANPKTVLVNFMNVISTEKSGGLKQGGISMKSELKAKVTSQKTQYELLSQLNRLLHVVFRESGEVTCDENIKESFDSQSSEKISGCKNDPKMTVIYVNQNPTLISNFSLKTVFSDLQISENQAWLVDFISSLAPVLFEYWVECCPAEFSMNLIPVKKATVTLQIMKEILEIFVTLLGCLQKSCAYRKSFGESLIEELLGKFNAHFGKVFPFNFTLQQSAKKSRKEETLESVTDFSLNMRVAQILSYYVPQLKLDQGRLPRWASEVLGYLQSILLLRTSNRQQSKLTVSEIKSLSILVKIFLLNLPEIFEAEKVELLQNIYRFFEGFRTSSNVRIILLKFLEEVLDDAKNRLPAMEAILDKWLKSLLTVFNSKITGPDVISKIFKIFKCGILQKFPSFTNAMVDALPCLFKVEVFSKLNEDDQRVVIEILWHIGEIQSQQLLGVLANLCNSGRLSLKVFEYLMFVIHQLVHPKKGGNVMSNLSGYLSFVLSIAVGHTEEELESFATETQNSYNFLAIGEETTIIAQFESGDDLHPQITSESWEYSNEVIKIVCQFLTVSDHSTRFLEMLQNALCKLFRKYTSLPLVSVYRLLYLVKTLMFLAKENENGHADSNEFMLLLAKWCSLSWFFSVTIVSKYGKVNFISDVVKQLKAVLIGLCHSSEIILQDVLLSFVRLVESSQVMELSCCVVTDVLKQLQDMFTEAHKSTLRELYEKFEIASNSGTLNSQTFSDFMYQYSSSVKFS